MTMYHSWREVSASYTSFRCHFLACGISYRCVAGNSLVYYSLTLIQDDASALHLPTMRRWNLILRVVMSEYLNLRPSDLVARDGGSFVRSNAELVRSLPLDLYQNSSMFVSRAEVYAS